MDIFKSILGRRLGISPTGELVHNHPGGVQNILGGWFRTVIPAAQVQALFTTPRGIGAAPSAGLSIIPRKALIRKPAGTAYAGIAAGEDLIIRYAGGGNTLMTIETTGFLDQATAQARCVFPTAVDFDPKVASSLVIALLVGDITTGTSDLTIDVWYDLIQPT